MQNGELYEKLISEKFDKEGYDIDKTLDKLEGFFGEKCHSRSYTKGDMIYEEGTITNYLYYIERGKVQIVKKGMHNKEYYCGYCMAGEFFGFTALMEAPSEYNFKALTNCSIYLIDISNIEKIFEHDHELHKYIKYILVNKIRVLTRRQSNIIAGSCKQVFSNFILEQMYQFGKLDKEGNILISLDISLMEIAEVLNMTRETLSRIISDMKKSNVIESKRRTFTILDLNKFIEFAE